jgi:hypothetical protein
MTDPIKNIFLRCGDHTVDGDDGNYCLVDSRHNPSGLSIDGQVRLLRHHFFTSFLCNFRFINMKPDSITMK